MEFQTVSRRGPKAVQPTVKYPAQQQQLVDMGFNEKQVKQALDFTLGDLEKATALLLGDLTREEVLPAVEEKLQEKPAEKVVAKKHSPRTSTHTNTSGGERRRVASAPPAETTPASASAPAPTPAASVPAPVPASTPVTTTAVKRDGPKEIPVHRKMMSAYKTIKCREIGNPAHDRKDCFYWHSYAERRRNPYETHYSPYECPNTVGGRECPEGDACLHAHSMLERMFHPELFKISPCQRSADGRKCERGSVCAFSHGLADQRISPSKTFPELAFEAPKPKAELVISEELASRLLELVKSAGEEGVHLNDIYRKFAQKFDEPLALDDMFTGKFKIREMFEAHPSVKLVFTRGNQPVFVYITETISAPEEESKEVKEEEKSASAAVTETANATATTTSSSKSSPLSDTVRERITQILLKAGAEGLIGSELPKKYLDTYGEKLDLGPKLKLKEILQSVPGVVTSAANRSQPKFTLVVDSSAASAPAPAAAEKPKAKTWSAIAAAAEKPKPAPATAVVTPPPAPAATISAPAEESTPTQQGKKEKQDKGKKEKKNKEAELAPAPPAKPAVKSFAAVVASQPPPKPVAAPVKDESVVESKAASESEVQPVADLSVEEKAGEARKETEAMKLALSQEEEAEKEAAKASASAVEVSTSVVEEILAAVPGEPSPMSRPAVVPVELAPLSAPNPVELSPPALTHSAPPNLSRPADKAPTMSKLVAHVSLSEGPVSLPPLLGSESALSNSLLFGIGGDKKDESTSAPASKLHELLYKAATRPEHVILPPGLTKQTKPEPVGGANNNNGSKIATAENEDLAKRLSQAQNQIASLQDQINAMQKEINTRKADYDAQSQLLKSTQQKLKEAEAKVEDFPKQLAKKEEDFHEYLQHYVEDFKCQNQERLVELNQASTFFSNIEFAIHQAKADEINVDTASKEQVMEVLKLFPSIRSFCSSCKQQYKYKYDVQNSRTPSLFVDPYAPSLANRSYQMQYPAQNVYEQQYFAPSQFPVTGYGASYAAPGQCALPGCHQPGVYQCTGCYNAVYCSQDHQSLHYPHHAPSCHH